MSNLQLRFDGTRFRGRLSLPVSCTFEIVVYQRLLEICAKENASISDIAKNGQNLVNLRLVGFREGSVISVLEIEPDSELKYFPDLVANASNELNSRLQILLQSPELIRRESSAFKSELLKLTKTTWPDESIEIQAANGSKVTYSSVNIAAIAKEAKLNNLYVGPATLLGTASQIDRKQTFKITSLSGHRISGDFDGDEAYQDFVDVMALEKENQVIWLDCKVNVTKIDPLAFKITQVLQLGEIGKIEDIGVIEINGFLSELLILGSAKAFPSTEAVINSVLFLNALQENQVRMPVLTSDFEKGLNFDWATKEKIMSVTVDFEGNFSAYFANFATGERNPQDRIENFKDASLLVRGLLE